MYNNAIIQSHYKPYVPLPKKKAAESGENKQSEPKGRIVNPNDYNTLGHQGQSDSDSFTKSQTSFTPPAKININQVLIDFNSTLNAIGATEEIEQEVKTYLSLVEAQSKKDAPNKKIIVSNLKIAADVLDTYISDTLKKPSKVVKDWVEALLLQNIDFKADASVTKGAFESITGEPPQTAKLAEKKLAEKAKNSEETTKQEVIRQEEQIENANVEKKHPDLQNQQIIALISQAENEMSSSPKDALNILSEAFVTAQKTSDKSAMAQIYSKIAHVQNGLNNISQALDCLNASTILAYETNNDGLKTHNHKFMGSIYDEAGYMNMAMAHYFASIGIDGELDDTANQADTLNSIGKMYTSRYKKDEAIEYYKEALELAKITSCLEVMSNSFYNTAITLKNAGETTKAVNNLKNAAILSEKTDNKYNLANIYEEAGDLMAQKSFKKRAMDFYKKSYRIAQKADDEEALKRLREKLYSFAA